MKEKDCRDCGRNRVEDEVIINRATGLCEECQELREQANEVAELCAEASGIFAYPLH